MKFAYTIIYVENVPLTVEQWSCCLGFELSYLHEDQIYAELISGETTIAFAHIEFGRSHFDDPDNIAAIFDRPLDRNGLCTDDVSTAYRHAIEHGMTAAKAPMTQPWGQEVAWVVDLNGILVELIPSRSLDALSLELIGVRLRGAVYLHHSRLL